MRVFGAAFLAFGGFLAFWYGVATSLGEVLFALHPPFLNTAQAVVQRRLSPWLWDAVILPALLWPVWALPVGIGALLVLFSLLRRR